MKISFKNKGKKNTLQTSKKAERINHSCDVM